MAASLIGDHATNLMTGRDYNSVTTSIGAAAGGVAGLVTPGISSVLGKAAISGIINGAVSDSVEQAVQGNDIGLDDVATNFAWSAGSSLVSSTYASGLQQPTLNPLAEPLTGFGANITSSTFIPVAKSFIKNQFVPFLGTCPSIPNSSN